MDRLRAVGSFSRECITKLIVRIELKALLASGFFCPSAICPNFAPRLILLAIKYVITTFGKDDSMAPKKPPRIPTGFDVQYTCTNDECELDLLDRDTELDDHTWTCNTCGEAVLIEMDDRAGNKIDVRRYQAQYVEKGQMVYLHHDLETAYFVKGSTPGMGKKNSGKVMLGLAEFRGVYFMADEYVNCVP